MYDKNCTVYVNKIFDLFCSVLVPLNLFEPSCNVEGRFFCYSSFIIVFITLSCLFFAGLRSPVRKRLVCVLCFVTFPYGVSGQVWYLIVSISDLAFLTTFYVTLCSDVHNLHL